MLRVRERINFKILLLTFKCLRNSAPLYLQELITEYSPSHTLRSSNRSLLKIPLINTQSYGSRSFLSASPQLWNNLPQCIKQADSTERFKSMLKTYLFIKQYDGACAALSTFYNAFVHLKLFFSFPFLKRLETFFVISAI